ncbi:MFS transporter [Neisseria sp. Ec49-e6-T10]|uniref:MFS transporter n=1 Tax=Neisseria sp. Ec49-e6-T10 TaxID=3140744 RepID=UPI003EBBE29B
MMQTSSIEQEIQPSRPINKNDTKTLSLASLGGALEFYDFIIFALFAKYMGDAFFPDTLSPFWKDIGSYGAFAAAYIMRPVGGVIMAHFGDLIGRKRMFAISILMMAAPTFAIGLLPTFDTIGFFAPILLLLMRIIQGIAIGGEVPSAWVFVSEHVPSRKIGLANGFLTCSLTFGILLGALMALLMEALFPEISSGRTSFLLGNKQDLHDWGWRIPFLVGGVLGFVTMYLRRWLHETPVFKEMQEKKALSKGIPLVDALKSYPKSVFVSMLLTWLLTCGILVGLILMPDLMNKSFHIPRHTVFVMNCLAILAAVLGCIFWGQLCDKLGAGLSLILGCTCLAISSYILYAHLDHTNYTTIGILYFIMGFCVGSVSVVPYVMIRMFPPNVRLSGVSFSYNLSYAIFGSSTPLLFVAIVKANPFGMAYYVLTLCAVCILCGFYLIAKKI